MAQNARDIRRRIRSVKSTEQITKAMEMVAAAKLRRAQERVHLARPYARKMEEVIGSIAKAGDVRHPMMVKRPVRKSGYVVITADRGLAGAYNANIIRVTLEAIRGKAKNEYTIIAVGRRGRDFFKKRDFPVAEEITGLSDYPTYADIKRVAGAAVKMYEEEVYDELFLVYNQFINPVQQTPVVKKILPLEDVGGEAEGHRLHYEYEPSAEAVLETLLPKYAETLIFSALLDAKASEHGARMTAMGNASDNAAEMIDTLTLALNRARQAAITLQISEIVGGAEALK
ncbi:ATP synthase F1 subunit gamma [Kyrpidia spormannii]|uniref:ATP synthase gamma chain n=2 Tax=Kyrpidia spormannii TaxID=2055160 RepID=A0A2K8NCL5_9BACL|nr:MULTISPECIES: ATP synthase F1 subunit gamma [Kyrpidia]HHY67602.1 ATP synthase F1 subunit gamma [Alicyclobacillus sp.]ATY86240.1 ATP synthase F1 subunit gamma [Kyrpidia spormannii]MCL6576540.1 ATP synthase F1 subunit gamma [Kyrpidia sp.]CAB3395676.1 ATP synthase (subunit gamma, component F1) [Kyrpidia spormannii]CAB3396264.1 ATP synthase (subunit gamma, component F1) [Kyrpidia spormannii]